MINPISSRIEGERIRAEMECKHLEAAIDSVRSTLSNPRIFLGSDISQTVVSTAFVLAATLQRLAAYQHALADVEPQEHSWGVSFPEGMGKPMRFLFTCSRCKIQYRYVWENGPYEPKAPTRPSCNEHLIASTRSP